MPTWALVALAAVLLASSASAACVPTVLAANTTTIIVNATCDGGSLPVSVEVRGLGATASLAGGPAALDANLGLGCTVGLFYLTDSDAARDPVPFSFCSMPAGVTVTEGACDASELGDRGTECIRRVTGACQLACCATQGCCSAESTSTQLALVDTFATNSYNDSVGPTDWSSTLWTEAFYPDDDNLPSSGRIYVTWNEIFFDCTTPVSECTNGHPFLVSRALPLPALASCDCTGVMEMKYELVGDPVYVSVANGTVLELAPGNAVARLNVSASCGTPAKIVIAWPSNNTCNGINYFGTWNVTVALTCATTQDTDYSTCSSCGSCSGGSCAGGSGAGRRSAPSARYAGSHTYGGPTRTSVSAIT